MTVRIRLARFGRKASPFYRLFVADARAPRDGKHIEIVGHYDPIPGKDGNKALGLNVERVKYWLAVGAQPSDRVAYLLWRAGLLPAPPIPHTPTRWVPRAQLRELAKAAKNKASFSTVAAAGTAAAAAARLAVACAPRTLGVGLGGVASARAAPCSFAGFARAPALFSAPLR